MPIFIIIIYYFSYVGLLLEKQLLHQKKVGKRTDFCYIYEL